MNNKYLYLIWKDPTSRRNFTIGKLTQGPKYTFSYLPDAKEARKNGWQFLNSFPEDRVYESEVVFPAFSSRLPDRKRRDINNILEKYNLKDYDEFELLKKSGARLPIDTYEFIDPIFPEDEKIQREFFIMGIRHKASCEGEYCDQLPFIEVGDSLLLVPEPDNKYDDSAIRITTISGNHLGYVPRYYNQEILHRLNTNSTYSCIIIEINKGHLCSECIKVRLNISSTTK